MGFITSLPFAAVCLVLEKVFMSEFKVGVAMTSVSCCYRGESTLVEDFQNKCGRNFEIRLVHGTFAGSGGVIVSLHQRIRSLSNVLGLYYRALIPR